LKKIKTRKSQKRKSSHSSGECSDLFNQVVQLTGLPTQAFKRELKRVLHEKNINVNTLTLEELRRVAASYLRQIMSSVLDRSTPKKSRH